MRKPFATSAAAVIALTLAGCGGDSDSNSDGEESPDEALAPACSEVWVAGETLPEDSEGCMNGDTLEAAASFTCEDGSSLFQYGDDFWAFGGQEIHEEEGGAASAEAYKAAYDTCQGG